MVVASVEWYEILVAGRVWPTARNEEVTHAVQREYVYLYAFDYILWRRHLVFLSGICYFSRCGSIKSIQHAGLSQPQLHCIIYIQYIVTTPVYPFLNFLKGTVHQKLRGVEYYINKKVFFSHWTADILFLNLKGNWLFKPQKTCFSGLKTINVAFPVQWGFRYKDW